jgi:hypothetical protein
MFHHRSTTRSRNSNQCFQHQSIIIIIIIIIIILYCQSFDHLSHSFGPLGIHKAKKVRNQKNLSQKYKGNDNLFRGGTIFLEAL